MKVWLIARDGSRKFIDVNRAVDTITVPSTPPASAMHSPLTEPSEPMFTDTVFRRQRAVFPEELFCAHCGNHPGGLVYVEEHTTPKNPDAKL